MKNQSNINADAQASATEAFENIDVEARRPASTMRVVCAWCGAEKPPVNCVPRMSGKTSHGICDKCAAEWPQSETESGIENLKFSHRVFDWIILPGFILVLIVLAAKHFGK